jgi:hypothetical protein
MPVGYPNGDAQQANKCRYGGRRKISIKFFITEFLTEP